VGLMHTLFTLEDNYGLKISEMDGEVCLKVDVRKSKDAARLHEMLCSWQQAAAMLEAGEISKEDYDKWRYHYPEFDTTQKRGKVMSQGLNELLKPSRTTCNFGGLTWDNMLFLMNYLRISKSS